MKQSSELSLTPEQERTALVGEYLYKYSIITGREIIPELVAVFSESLSDLSDARLRAGLEEYLRAGKGFPWPSDIRDMSEL